MPNEEYRDIVICNNCLLAASILIGRVGFKICPICGNSNLETIPVNDYEAYTMNIQGNNIEIEFTTDK